MLQMPDSTSSHPWLLDSSVGRSPNKRKGANRMLPTTADHATTRKDPTTRLARAAASIPIANTVAVPSPARMLITIENYPYVVALSWPV